MHLDTQYKLNSGIKENGQQLKLPRIISNWRVFGYSKRSKRIAQVLLKEAL